MRQRHILLFLLLLSCGTKTEKAVNHDFKDETFNQFFERFKEDSLYQLDRVKFPLTLETWDIDDKLTTETIEKEDWRHLKFEYSDDFATRQIDAYTQVTKVYADSAKIELRGVDNGIHVDYLFTKVDGLWVLSFERDYSN